MTSEFDRAKLLARVLAAKNQDNLVVPNGDDAAVLRISGDLVITSDALVEGVDFAAWAPWEAVGWKAVAANVSDLAAMGAISLGYLSTLCLPARFDDAALSRLTAGMRDAGEAFHLGCVGGDLSGIAGPVVISITALGTVQPGRALTRAGAKPGDAIVMGGALGGAAAGLRLLMEHGVVGPLSVAQALEVFAPGAQRDAVKAQLMPQAQWELGAALCGVAHACMDVSDGFIQDLCHLLVASGVGAVLDARMFPQHPGVAAVARSQEDAQHMTLAGGEEFVLLATLPADAVAPLQRVFPHLVQVGRVQAERALDMGGQKFPWSVVEELDRGLVPSFPGAAALAGFRHT